MTTFKVGDRVRVIPSEDSASGSGEFFAVGCEGIVEDQDPFGIHVQFDPNDSLVCQTPTFSKWWAHPSELEVINDER